MNQDLDQLRLLSIFHFVVGGMAALLSCIPFIHFFLGLAMTAGWLEDVDPAGQVFGVFFMVFAGLVILTGWAFAACVINAGRFLGARKRYMFCLVMAAVECIFMPFGTVLGVLTIIVLNRPSVKRLFGVDEDTAAVEAGDA
jgi:hypothetical protein